MQQRARPCHREARAVWEAQEVRQSSREAAAEGWLGRTDLVCGEGPRIEEGLDWSREGASGA